MYSKCHSTYSSSVCGHYWTWGRNKIPTDIRYIKVRPRNDAAALVKLLCKIQRRSSCPPTFKRKGDTIPPLHGNVCLCQNQEEIAGRNATLPLEFHMAECLKYPRSWEMQLSPSTGMMWWCEGGCLPQLSWTISTTIQLQQQQPLISMKPAFLCSSTQPRTMKVRRVNHFNLETRRHRQS